MSRLCFVLINSVLLNLLCVWIFGYSEYILIKQADGSVCTFCTLSSFLLFLLWRSRLSSDIQLDGADDASSIRCPVFLVFLEAFSHHKTAFSISFRPRCGQTTRLLLGAVATGPGCKITKKKKKTG